MRLFNVLSGKSVAAKAGILLCLVSMLSITKVVGQQISVGMNVQVSRARADDPHYEFMIAAPSE